MPLTSKANIKQNLNSLAKRSLLEITAIHDREVGSREDPEKSQPSKALSQSV